MTDIRDGETYRVRKLADGNIWMTENLRKSFVANEVLTPATTDVLINTTVDTATQAPTQENNEIWATETSTPTQEQVDRWLSRGTSGATGNMLENSVVSDAARRTGENQKIGIYYNWFTATAGTGTYAMDANGATASSSICPRNWQLPRHQNKNSWAELLSTYGIAEEGSDYPLQAFPLSLPYAGFVNGISGAINLQGADGIYWAANSHSQYRSYILIFIDFRSIANLNKFDGLTVRCIAK